MDWNAHQPIILLPEIIRRYFQSEANYLYADLKNNKIKVTLLPASNQKFLSHKVHAIEQSNPGWYSELYHAHAHFRRDRSLNALERITNLDDKAFYEFKHKKCKLEYIFTVSKKTKHGKYRKKQRVRQILKPVIKLRYGYDSRYLDFILERLTRGYKQNNYLVPPNDDVVDYFSNKTIDEKLDYAAF